MQIPAKPLVCFDLGGVLARIRRTWGACAAAVGIEIGCDPSTELSSCSAFDDYQNGLLTDEAYVAALGTFLRVDGSAAISIHAAILDQPYAGVGALVLELRSQGVTTACLSNTNALHWPTLDSPRFEGIHSLDIKVASHDTKLMKPDPRMFEVFERIAGRKGGEVVFFDDHGQNVQASLDRGWKGTLIDPAGDTAAQMRSVLSGLGILDC